MIRSMKLTQVLHLSLARILMRLFGEVVGLALLVDLELLPMSSRRMVTHRHHHEIKVDTSDGKR